MAGLGIARMAIPSALRVSPSGGQSQGRYLADPDGVLLVRFVSGTSGINVHIVFYIGESYKASV